LQRSTVKFEEDKVEIIKDDASIKKEIVPAGLSANEVQSKNTATPWYQISSKNVFIVVVVVVAVVVLVTALVMVSLFYVRSNEDKLKMLDFDNQLNANGSYRELCRQRYDAKLSERLLGSNGDAPKDQRGSVASLRSNKHPSSVSSWSEEPITSTLDIFSGHAILSYMEDHLQNTTRLDTEWNALCQYQADGVSYDAAMENIRKNRSSALPYDHNRVKLHRDNGDNETDYINASFIIDNDPTLPVYIACQGPLPSTVNDFWQMIWQQKCAAIVMLTPIIECGEVQCARYWPDEGSSQYGKYEIHLVSEHIWCEDYLVRSLYMKNVESGETRTLTQFHFLAFPHDSIPTSPIPLLEMRRKVSKCYRGTNTPIVVHCNDGVGRTGTYMLIDMVLNRIVKGKSREIDVAATLEHLRDQRANVVENKNQLQFALAAVAEEVNAMLKLNKASS